MRGFEVEWCAGCPVRDGETDLDNADIRFQDFKDLAAARRYAKRMLKKDFFGSVQINEFVMEPFEPGYPGLTKEYIGKTEYVD